MISTSLTCGLLSRARSSGMANDHVGDHLPPGEAADEWARRPDVPSSAGQAAGKPPGPAPRATRIASPCCCLKVASSMLSSALSSACWMHSTYFRAKHVRTAVSSSTRGYTISQAAAMRSCFLLQRPRRTARLVCTRTRTSALRSSHIGFSVHGAIHTPISEVIQTILFGF